MRIRFSACLVVAILALQPSATQSQVPKTGTDAVTRAVRAELEPAIDGKENDAVWRTAPAMSDFLEFSPTEGKAPRFRTEFKVAYDDRNLYVFIRAFDPNPDSIMTSLTRRDVRGPSDQLKVMIDSYNDRRSGFEFAVNPRGVKRDYAMYNDNSEDDAWDGVWDVATRIDSVGWTAEYRIPFSQLRYANISQHVFGFAIWRDIERYKERSSWPLYRQSQNGISSQLGLLTGVNDITPFHRLEITPYAVAKSSSVAVTSAPAGSSPWTRGQALSGGADLKYGLNPNLTLDATVNPDFGQVESDPSVLNLSAFETFFQERRPFFIEGSGAYSFGINCSIVTCSGEGLFYSRRIGRSPQLFGRYGDAASPNVTPILGATKLTGRAGSGLSFGVLDALTGRLEGTLDRTTEPTTNYSVLRMQQDFRNGGTNVGIIATDVHRSLDAWTENFLRRDALAYGGSLFHRFGKSRYELTANVTASDVSGSRQSIANTQLSSVHYYQRPDGGLRYDSTRTSLTGDEEQLTFGKFGGNMIHFQTAYDRRTAGYEINDLGYLQRANQQTFNNWAQLGWRKPTKAYRQLTGNFNFWEFWTINGLQTERAFNTNWHMQLPNNVFLNAGTTISRLGGVLCEVCSRGGPAVRRSPSFNWNTSVQGDDRHRIVPNLFVGGQTSDDGRSSYTEIAPGIQIIPISQLQITLSADFLVNHDNTQWFGNFGDATGVTHYSFARLNQQQRSLSTRVNYTVSPTLTVQVYAAPFVSRGEYVDIRQLSATPRATDYADRFTTFSPPSSSSLGFDVLQLRSTSVVRWEFRPASTLFFVWTHNRDGSTSVYSDRPFTSEYQDLLALHPVNTFLMKAAYWIN